MAVNDFSWIGRFQALENTIQVCIEAQYGENLRIIGDNFTNLLV